MKLVEQQVEPMRTLTWVKKKAYRILLLAMLVVVLEPDIMNALDASIA